MQVTVEVTQQMIDEAYCPIEAAIKAIVTEDCDVSVYDTFVELDIEDRDLPLEVVSFIEDHDDGFPVAPFSFSLDIPSQYLRTP